MNIIRYLASLYLLSSVAFIASGQTVVKHHKHHSHAHHAHVSGTGYVRSSITPANMQQLSALQSDLVAAIGSMTSALPIYNHHREHAIRAAYKALVLVDKAISGSYAVHRSTPTAKDNVSFKYARTEYSAQQLAQSQFDMERGMASLNAAVKEYQAAVGSTPNKAGVKVAGDLRSSLGELGKAVTLQAKV